LSVHELDEKFIPVSLAGVKYDDWPSENEHLLMA
jgi:hypothetical protein